MQTMHSRLTVISVIYLMTMLGSFTSCLETVEPEVEETDVVYPGQFFSRIKDEISSVVAPGIIAQNQSVELSISYSAAQERDIIIVFQQNHAPHTTVKSETIKSKIGSDLSLKFQFTVPSTFDLEDSYQFQVILAPTNGDWNSKVAYMPSGVVTATAENMVNEDKIIATSAPATITAGTDIEVSVSYSATRKRDILVILQEQGGLYQTQVATKVQSHVGTNLSAKASLLVPSSIDVNKKYQVQVILAPINGGWDGKLSNKEVLDITAEPRDNSFTGIYILARGNCGTEQMVLEVDGKDVKTWQVSAKIASYHFDNYRGGNVKVKFSNDGIEGCDRNFYLDQIIVGGTSLQTEDEANRTGCGDMEWLWCDGNFDFGDRSANL